MTNNSTLYPKIWRNQSCLLQWDKITYCQNCELRHLGDRFNLITEVWKNNEFIYSTQHGLDCGAYFTDQALVEYALKFSTQESHYDWSHLLVQPHKPGDAF